MALLEDPSHLLQLFNKVSVLPGKEARSQCRVQESGVLCSARWTVGEYWGPQEPFDVALSINLQCVSLSLGVKTYI